jgi:integrase
MCSRTRPGDHSTHRPPGRRFRKLCAAAGIPGDRHPHELRHTCASYLSVKLGMAPEQVADVLGHSGPATLFRTCRHANIVPVAMGTERMSAIFDATG